MDTVNITEILKFITDVGFPIAASMVSGYLVFLTLKFILAGVTSTVKGMAAVIVTLDNRVKAMNDDIVRIDTIVSTALGLKPDTDRISRTENKDDICRK